MVAESATLNGLMPPSEHNSRLCAITYDVTFRVKLDRSFERFLGFRPVPGVVKCDKSQRRVRVGQCGIDLQRPLGSMLGSTKRNARGEDAIKSEHRIGVSEACIGERETGVIFDRLFVARDALPECVLRSIVPVVPTFKVEYIRICTTVRLKFRKAVLTHSRSA